MITLTRTGLLLTLSTDTIPAQGSSGVPISFVNDPETYSGYTIQPLAGWYRNGCKQSAVCRYADDTIMVPAAAFQQNGEIMLAVALIDPSDANHIEVTQPASAYIIPAPTDPTELPDEDTWQAAVDAFMEQVMQPYQTSIQSAIDTATQQQQQIDSAISQMGEYQIVSEDPVQIQLKQGDGTFGPTVDLGDGLASKSMVNAGYYQSIGSQYSGSASDYGIQVEEIVGAYSQGLNPSPDNPQEMQAVEIGNLYSVGKNLLNNKNFKNKSNGDTTGVATETGVTITGNYFVYYVIDNVPKNTDLYLSYTKSGAGRNQVSIYDNENFDNLIASKDGSFIYFNVGEYESIAIVFYCSNGTANTSTYSNIMLNVGSTAEPYTPYTGTDTVTLSEPLILRALPNGVCDTYENGVITRRVGVVEFDGSADENWSRYTTNGINQFSITLSNLELSSGDAPEVLSDKFRPININDRTNNYNTVYAGQNKATIGFNIALDITTVEDWKTWLQSNPITVWYQLATPTEQDISIPTLKSFYPFTNAWCDSVVQPQITWNALTFGSSTVQNSGSTLNTFDVKGAGFFISQDDESVTIGTYDEWVAAGKPAWPTS